MRWCGGSLLKYTEDQGSVRELRAVMEPGMGMGLVYGTVGT